MRCCSLRATISRSSCPPKVWKRVFIPRTSTGFSAARISTNVTLEQDADGDGFVEVLEGAPAYGPILLNLLTDPDAAFEAPIGEISADLPFPATGEDGQLLYAQTFVFDDDGRFDEAIFDEIMPLENRHLVIHGQSAREGDGEGTEGEVDGTAGYKPALPVANGEIVEVTDPFAKLVALTNLMDDQEEVGAMASANADLRWAWPDAHWDEAPPHCGASLRPDLSPPMVTALSQQGKEASGRCDCRATWDRGETEASQPPRLREHSATLRVQPPQSSRRCLNQ